MNTLVEAKIQTKLQVDTNTIYDLIIIGAGPTGLAAAIYAGRMMLTTLVLGDGLGDTPSAGGMIAMTDIVENYPGFTRISGRELGEKFHQHALDYADKVAIAEAKAESAVKEGDLFTVQTNMGVFKAKTLIFASGARWRKLDMPGATEFEHKGVYYCALCDGPLFQGKTVAVVGGSDKAAKEALLLAGMVGKVFIIYRGEKLRPEPVHAEKLAQQPNIEIINNTQITKIVGAQFVEAVELDKPYNGSTTLPIDAVFGAIGQLPNSLIASSLGVALNDKQEIIIDREAHTNLAGVFAAGDVADLPFKQAITGVGEGVIAAHSAYLFVSGQNH